MGVIIHLIRFIKILQGTPLRFMRIIICIFNLKGGMGGDQRTNNNEDYYPQSKRGGESKTEKHGTPGLLSSQKCLPN